MYRVLVVDDEPAVRRFLRGSLALAGYQVFEAATGLEAIATVKAAEPDAILLDLGLPDVDGGDVTRMIREWSDVPILIVSVRDEEGEMIDSLDAGADDYLVKPFSLPELMARLRAAIRRGDGSSPASTFTSGRLWVDLESRVVEVEGERVLLTPTEFDLLRTLIRYAGRVLTHAQLLHKVWGEEYVNDLQLLRVNISNLRKKIEVEPRRPQQIVTELGVGYRLKVSEAR